VRCVGVVVPTSRCGAQSVVLAWIPSSSTNVVGYRIYYGTTSLNYSSQVTVGNTNRATVSGLAEG